MSQKARFHDLTAIKKQVLKRLTKEEVEALKELGL